MSKTFVTAMIVSCDTPECRNKSDLIYPEEIPEDWVVEDEKFVCDVCISKRPCEHYGKVPRRECDICKGLRCPDCKLLLEQETYWYEHGFNPFTGGALIDISGHWHTCKWIIERKKKLGLPGADRGTLEIIKP